MISLIWSQKDFATALGLKVTEHISKSQPHYARLAMEAGMECIGDDEEYYEFEGTKKAHEAFLMAAHHYEQTRD